MHDDEGCVFGVGDLGVAAGFHDVVGEGGFEDDVVDVEAGFVGGAVGCAYEVVEFDVAFVGVEGFFCFHFDKVGSAYVQVQQDVIAFFDELVSQL